jgi:hypothetical protein
VVGGIGDTLTCFVSIFLTTLVFHLAAISVANDSSNCNLDGTQPSTSGSGIIGKTDTLTVKGSGYKMTHYLRASRPLCRVMRQTEIPGRKIMACLVKNVLDPVV